MREIKFRAWSGKSMIYSGSHTDSENQLDLFFCAVSEYKALMQYTGFHDSNDKEIYEGDVICFDRREWGGEDNIHIVSWDEKDGSWSWGGGITSDMEWRTVIGNIYDNPELIK